MLFRLIGFGIRVWGCLYAAYWAIFFGSCAFLIINSYMKERGHHSPTKPAAHERRPPISVDISPRPH